MPIDWLQIIHFKSPVVKITAFSRKQRSPMMLWEATPLGMGFTDCFAIGWWEYLVFLLQKTAQARKQSNTPVLTPLQRRGVKLSQGQRIFGSTAMLWYILSRRTMSMTEVPEVSMFQSKPAELLHTSREYAANLFVLNSSLTRYMGWNYTMIISDFLRRLRKRHFPAG